uniref:Uncharacterized protein n=1 Tax=Molossus molossus TaxID=27622 RepID=A0A7J8IZ30_MOLMO|nr:hypothetical protein HJG59_010249 [Molossus molossus]
MASGAGTALPGSNLPAVSDSQPPEPWETSPGRLQQPKPWRPARVGNLVIRHQVALVPLAQILRFQGCRDLPEPTHVASAPCTRDLQPLLHPDTRGSYNSLRHLWGGNDPKPRPLRICLLSQAQRGAPPASPAEAHESGAMTLGPVNGGKNRRRACCLCGRSTRDAR